ncbi:MAG: hypothetical protein LUG98_13455 [Tannerellaceae bacterium]|nr:hypothetical protein [Tannerellaceae bacterium]
MQSKFQVQHKFFLCFMLLLGVIFAVGAILDPESSVFCLSGLGGTTFASMMAIGNIEDVSDKHTFGSNITYQVYPVAVSQLDKTKKFPKPNTNREVATLPMAAGEYMKYFIAHDFPTFIASAEKGDISSSGTNTFTMIMGGVRPELLNFLEEHIGDKFILIFKEIESDIRNILGSDERPVILKSFEVKNDKDGRYITLTFERNSVNLYNIYTGAIVTQPATTHTADSDELNIVAGQELYTIPEGTAGYIIDKVKGITASDKGRVITLNGSGSDNPGQVKENSVFILEDGATWTAKSGSTISFKILDSSTLVEIAGSRVQTA